MTDTTDEGFGLIEIVVAMMILALLSISALPVLVGGMRLAAGDSSVTTATGLVGAQMTLARAAVAPPQSSSCSNLTSFAAAAVPTVTDGAGRTLSVTKTVTCPNAPGPGTAPFTVRVTANGSGTVLASAITLIYVSGS